MLKNFITALLICSSVTAAAQTSVTATADTVFSPTVVYSQRPRQYTIADIEVNGATNYQPEIIRSYAGLKPGEVITIPGEDITNAAKRLMRQGLFSQVQIKITKTVGDKVWLEYALRQQPRIDQVRYDGMKKNEREDLQERLHLMPGNQITPEIVNRIERITREYFDGKGFKNADVRVTQQESLSSPNSVILTIEVDRHNKVKVHRIYFEGNDVFSDGRLRRVFKKTTEKGDLLKLFSQKKFVESDYHDDLNRLIEFYNEHGYRDAVIVADSVVPYNDKTVDVYVHVEEGNQYHLSDINWVGNTIYPTHVLNSVLGMKAGDVYNQKLLAKRLTEDEDAVSSIYSNNGYLFIRVLDHERDVKNDSVALELQVIEGPQARINRVDINGNDRLYEKVVRRELYVRPGELWNRENLIRSVREIANTGHFDPESVTPDIQPNEEDGTVDVAFDLVSKANDQVEFSLGWGQSGIIGKVGLKFTNFSIKNLLYPSTYKGLIPQGEGQTFSISAQTNARYYQAYSISFLDPWFGGKRPNQLSVSAYFSRQTGISSSFYNKNYLAAMNTYGYGYGYGYGSYGYGSGYNYQDAYDPNKVLQMVGVNVGFGKRLNWPDDYFTFQAELGYNLYYLKNWEYLYYMKNGSSNSIVLGLTLSRNSIDNPLYTRRGSTFSLNLQLTPPASLFMPGRDWNKLGASTSEADAKERYKWIEYWKLRFKSRTYTPLTDVDGKWTLVMMTRADFGLLGSYNKNLKSPFETFYVGGDGMSGSYTYATETIALRGYDNGALTPYGKDGYAYTRFGVELHFPFLLQPTTTIYGIAFAEAGNAWTSVGDFNPFQIKRSAGAGVRVYLPMVGMMGIDWAYGFDRDMEGQRGGSHFHFVLGQEF